MAETFVEKFSRFMGNNPSLGKVADDLQLTSELILLVRMIFADGELKPEELDAFKRICGNAFNLKEEDIPGVLQYLKDFGYETTAWDAAAMFAGHDIERKRALLVHLLRIAKSDGHLDSSEAELIRKTAGVLGLTPEDISAANN
ncbi:TerB family tellurite resistance protein [Salaquimonas pukyongi]|uniref:tellurite resistance TerB family protein n=1 Tax=Salaquimonas pukyongi TaxID=2712698 RepID=UPI00096B75B3|nr:TerB family tellurite resistance protein [Salaquimonas pukyongi]